MWDLQPIYSICDEFGNLVFDNHWLKPILVGSILIVSGSGGIYPRNFHFSWRMKKLHGSMIRLCGIIHRFEMSIEDSENPWKPSVTNQVS